MRFDRTSRKAGPSIPCRLPARSVVALCLLGLLLPQSAAGDPLEGASPPQAALAPGFPAPDALPGGNLDAAVDAWSRGDLPGARLELAALLSNRKIWGADRTRAHFLTGWVASRMGHHQQASANFYQVRKLEEHPLKEAAAFFEARADLHRGHPNTAIAECGTYRDTWAEGRWFDECLLVEADAHVALRQHRAAAELYEEFLDSHPDDQRRETIQLRIAAALEEEGRHEEAARRYRGLYISHQLPMTARLATAGLERMRSAGVEITDVTDQQLYVRACSLRTAGLYDDSWDLYCELLERAKESEEAGEPALRRKLSGERHDFLWRNRQYEEVGRSNARAYKREPNGPGAAENLYWAMEGFAKAGLYAKSVEHQELGLVHFPAHRRFRRTWQRTSKLYAGAGQYAEARASLQEWQTHSSRARRSSETKFYVAYYAYRSGDHDTAITELTPLAQGRSKRRTAALFFRGKAHEAAGDRREARRDFKQVLDEKPDGWYATVIRSRRRLKAADAADLELARSGRWPGTAKRHAPLPAIPSATSLPDSIASSWPHALPGTIAPLHPPEDVGASNSDGRRLPTAFDSWSSSSLFEPSADSEAMGDEPSAAVAVPVADGLTEFEALVVPPTWAESKYWDPQEGRELWEEFATEQAGLWPELPLAYELSRCGLGEIAGPILAGVYEEVRDVRRSKRRRSAAARWRSSGGRHGGAQAERWAAITDINMDAGDWRMMFAAAGYPASVSAFSLDSVPFRTTPRTTPEGRDVWTLRFPAAYAPHVWRSGWEYDVDPLLMLSIMRAESLYKHDAVSRVGALGLVQVMPTTGNKVAALMGDTEFRVDRLLEPEVNIRLGAYYLGQLMDRFGEGQFPLGVGSYNGGPHNVGRWLRPKVGMPFEEFVEEIQFGETRGYVKKVVSFYGIYCELYGDGAWVALPAVTHADDPSVINF